MATEWSGPVAGAAYTEGVSRAQAAVATSSPRRIIPCIRPSSPSTSASTITRAFADTAGALPAPALATSASRCAWRRSPSTWATYCTVVARGE